jgi:recombination protein RecR
MAEHPDIVQRLINAFERLPGVGARSAERFAYHVLEASEEEAAEFARAVLDLKRDAKECRYCYNISGQEVCSICGDKSRDDSTICVVETYQDVTAIERTGAYRGLYHVLRGHLAPLEGKGPEQLTVRRLLERARGGKVREVILATNPTMEGDGTAMFLAQELAKLDVKITRLARGIPAGGSVKLAGKSILSDALEGRTKL